MAQKKTEGARLGAGKITELDRLIDELSGPLRRTRQEASHTISQMAKDDPDAIEAQAQRVIEALVDALFRPEAQTRWESLDALAELAPKHPEAVSKAVEGAEASLFDEGSATVRVAAFRLLARIGAASPEASDTVWQLLDEAIQCFHGDQGYRGMLQSLLELVRGDASDACRKALVERISFDAESGRGYVKTCSAEIVEAANAK